MASKGQKFNSYSIELKDLIINEYKTNHLSYREISIKYNISKGTIKGWLRKFNQGKELALDNRGRPKNPQNIDYKERYEILKKYQAFLMAQRDKK